MLITFFYLLAGHALADYSLQTDFIAKGKNRHTSFPGMPWLYVMLAHCLIHAGIVLLLTNNIWCGLFELVAHFVLDCLKCEGKTNIHHDQIGHVLCKLAYIPFI